MSQSAELQQIGLLFDYSASNRSVSYANLEHMFISIIWYIVVAISYSFTNLFQLPADERWVICTLYAPTHENLTKIEKKGEIK